MKKLSILLFTLLLVFSTVFVSHAEERTVVISSWLEGVHNCQRIFPSQYHELLCGEKFKALHKSTDFAALCERVKKLVATRPQTK